LIREDELIELRRDAARRGLTFVFTNGCFDLLHAGHLHVLREAKKAGDILAVGLNSDRSVRILKGPGRPLMGEEERAELLAALDPVDFVVFFSEETPQRLIEALEPDLLVKGGDYQADQIVGAETVRRGGGGVLVVPLRQGLSTSALIEKIREAHGG
jgi:D-beta-D-heptose 7-phosphate kinase/D-beta-D-heptose 1-phosphate adenosyltransferase